MCIIVLRCLLQLVAVAAHHAATHSSGRLPSQDIGLRVHLNQHL